MAAVEGERRESGVRAVAEAEFGDADAPAVSPLAAVGAWRLGA